MKKTGGRKKGTVNARLKPVRLIDQFSADYPNLNPLSELVKIALDSETELSLKIGCWKEIAKYRLPTLKPVSAAINIDESLPEEPVQMAEKLIGLSLQGELLPDETKILLEGLKSVLQIKEFAELELRILELEKANV